MSCSNFFRALDWQKLQEMVKFFFFDTFRYLKLTKRVINNVSVIFTITSCPMKPKISKKRAAKNMSRRSCGYWNCSYELRRKWVSKKFGCSEKKEAYDTLKK